MADVETGNTVTVAVVAAELETAVDIKAVGNCFQDLVKVMKLTNSIFDGDATCVDVKVVKRELERRIQRSR